MDERAKQDREGTSYQGMVLLTEENKDKQSMIQSIDSIQQSQSTIANNITKMLQMMKQVIKEHQAYLR